MIFFRAVNFNNLFIAVVRLNIIYVNGGILNQNLCFGLLNLFELLFTRGKVVAQYALLHSYQSIHLSVVLLMDCIFLPYLLVFGHP